MLKDVLCKIGLHDKQTVTNFYPSIHAEVVTEYSNHSWCLACGKQFLHEKYVWNPEAFEFEGPLPIADIPFNKINFSGGDIA